MIKASVACCSRQHFGGAAVPQPLSVRLTRRGRQEMRQAIIEAVLPAAEADNCGRRAHCSCCYADEAAL
jgi:hypothetical protein